MTRISEWQSHAYPFNQTTWKTQTHTKKKQLRALFQLKEVTAISNAMYSHYFKNIQPFTLENSRCNLRRDCAQVAPFA